MNDDAATVRLEHERPPARARVKRRAPLSPVWLIPVIALGLAAYLAWTRYNERGPTIEISFETAEGLEAGKTQIRYKEVNVGLVTDVRISADLRRVIATAEMRQSSEPYTSAGTRFWIVRPRVDTAGISGLGTIVSGSYIEADPGSGETVYEFVGLEEPPSIRSDIPGKHFVLRAHSLGSVLRGAPIFYRGLAVGQVLGYELAPDNARRLLIDIFVREPFDDLVTPDARFWNASGIAVNTTSGGLSVRLVSLQALLSGGIVFEAPRLPTSAPPATAGTEFALFKDETEAQQANFTRGEPFLVAFDGGTRGLVEGAPVEIRGIRIGTVLDVQLAFSQPQRTLVAQALIEIQPDLINAVDADTGRPSPPRPLSELVARGLRAQLKTGNLLTGDLYVDLDFHPDALPASLGQVGEYRLLPSVPTELETIQASATAVLNKLASAPVDQLVTSLTKTAQAVEGFVASPEARETVAELQRTLGEFNRMTGPLVASLQDTSETAAVTLQTARETFEAAQATLGPGAPLQADLRGLVDELQSAARSVRLFADYLDRHPEALLRGRSGSYR